MLIPEQINLYIAGQPEWQRKVLVRLRQLIHSANADVQESWRSQTPHFDLGDAPVIGLAATKTSVCATFVNGAHFKSAQLPYAPCAEGKSGRSLKFQEGDPLPEAAFATLVQRAMAWQQKTSKGAEAEGIHPAHAELENILRKDPTAWANWGAFSPSHRKEYLEWVADGKKEETRKRRIAQALEMIREGNTKDEALHRVKGS